jgi:hypothetical protein
MSYRQPKISAIGEARINAIQSRRSAADGQPHTRAKASAICTISQAETQ